MAVENRNYLTVVKYEDFDPSKVNPGEVIIVDVLGMHAVYIGTSAGEAQRMAMYEEEKQFVETVRQAAAEADQSRANAAVLYELTLRRSAEVNDAAMRAKNSVEETADSVKQYTEKAMKQADIINQQAIDKAQEAALRAEKALAAVNKTVELLQNTVSAVVGAYTTINQTDTGGGGK